MLSLNFLCTDTPHAPLADAFEVDDFLLDDCCNLSVTDTVNAALTGGGSKLSVGSEDEEEMEQDELDMFAEVTNDDSFSEDEDGLNKEDEYPELIKTCGESAVESESYDFTVMDTEKDMNSFDRKRKADNSTTLKKKRVK
ncbi:hypothetical protein WUBG_09999 [Wuchereria bancrofti]|uniref:Uncharacterized protein n=1 Tax=Wuchereria bancrofti TaxID=6293 RepID=J9EV58_WUCBA|nr:hypothetical protein WUBG_09999 [Wuchereria bancrofti]VDM07784.1 unnamed protein product [Wuchereria bancrofti]